MGAQLELVPMRRDLIEPPEYRGHRLVAHLLGHRDPIGLDLAVGVIGASADPQSPVVPQEHELDFAAGMRAHRLDLSPGGEPRRRYAVEDRRHGRAFDAERLKLPDVLLHRRGVAPRPAGDDHIVDADLAPYRGAATLQRQGQGLARHANSRWGRPGSSGMSASNSIEAEGRRNCRQKNLMTAFHPLTVTGIARGPAQLRQGWRFPVYEDACASGARPGDRDVEPVPGGSMPGLH